MKTLELNIKRFKTPEYCIGKLSIDNKYFCDTLEDTDRGLKQTDPLLIIQHKKKAGITAIPTGRYEVTLNVKSTKYSNFKKYPWAEPYDGKIPRLLNVPGFEGILIHVGNYPKDTEGCILVGYNKQKGAVLSSKDTFIKLMGELQIAAKASKRIFITIE